MQDAFADASAREDEQRFINEAVAYKNEIIPLARGEAKQIIEEAKAYKVKLINAAEGEALRFKQLFSEYEKSPVVTRERLYLESVESVLGNTTKVMIDIGNNLLYLPLDKILESKKKEDDNSSTIGSDNQNSLIEKYKETAIVLVIGKEIYTMNNRNILTSLLVLII